MTILLLLGILFGGPGVSFMCALLLCDRSFKKEHNRSLW